MNGKSDAENWWRSHGEYVHEQILLDEIAWLCFIEAAVEHEAFTDDNGEWLEGYPKGLDGTNLWHQYCKDFCNMLESIQEACREWDSCGNDPYVYYGVSRSDFA